MRVPRSFHCCFVLAKFREVWLFLTASDADSGAQIDVDSEYALLRAECLRRIEAGRALCGDCAGDERHQDQTQNSSDVADGVEGLDLIGVTSHEIQDLRRASSCDLRESNVIEAHAVHQCDVVGRGVAAQMDGE